MEQRGEEVKLRQDPHKDPLKIWVKVFVEEKIGKLVIGLKMADFNRWKIAEGNANLRLVVTLLMCPTIIQEKRITNVGYMETKIQNLLQKSTEHVIK